MLFSSLQFLGQTGIVVREQPENFEVVAKFGEHLWRFHPGCLKREGTRAPIPDDLVNLSEITASNTADGGEPFVGAVDSHYDMPGRESSRTSSPSRRENEEEASAVALDQLSQHDSLDFGQPETIDDGLRSLQFAYLEEPHLDGSRGFHSLPPPHAVRPREDQSRSRKCVRAVNLLKKVLLSLVVVFHLVYVVVNEVHRFLMSNLGLAINSSV